MLTCKAPNCHSSIKANGYCSAHYFRLRRSGSLELSKNKRENLALEGKSFCPRCKNDKLFSEFNKDIHTANGYAIYCQSCNSEKGKQRYVKYKPKYQNYRLLKKFGVSIEEYETMLKKQDGGCAICSEKYVEGDILFAVDHCHNTGQVRGILCSSCNLGLGHFKDSQTNLSLAIEYLSKKT